MLPTAQLPKAAFPIQLGLAILQVDCLELAGGYSIFIDDHMSNVGGKSRCLRAKRNEMCPL